MAATYRIIEVLPPSDRVPSPGIVTLDVDFDDGTPTYRKRMMAPVTDKDALVATIEGWLEQYLLDREVPVVPDEVRALVVGSKRRRGSA